jgi:hypothetical protein
LGTSCRRRGRQQRSRAPRREGLGAVIHFWRTGFVWANGNHAVQARPSSPLTQGYAFGRLHRIHDPSIQRIRRLPCQLVRRRRLVNSTIPRHLLSPTPYRDALMAGRGRFRRRGQEGRGAPAAQPAGERADLVRCRGVPRGRGTTALQGDGDRMECGEAARGAGSGHGRGRGARNSGEGA